MRRSELPADVICRPIVELAAARLETQMRSGPRGPHGPSGPLNFSIEARCIGGLASGGVYQVDARGKAPDGRHLMTSLILKPLTGESAREAAVYGWLNAQGLGDIAPGVVETTLPQGNRGGRQFLVLERLRPARAWPWRDPALGARMLERLAAFHEAADPASFIRHVPPTGRDAQLDAEVADTLRVAERSMSWGALRPLASFRLTVHRVARALLDDVASRASPLPATVLHGDLHSGNVVVRRNGAITLLDWSRARVGPPLEDVASWLQSLAFWEWEIRRHHDTLLRRYLTARGLPGPLTEDVRAAYWVAAAHNAFTGALRHHVMVAEDHALVPAVRETSARALRDWFRIIRRADRALARRGGTAAPRTPARRS